MLDLNSKELQFALRVVQQASMLVRQVQAELTDPALTKNDRSPVTVADFAAQALIAYHLGQTFPGETLVAEEASQALREPQAAETLLRVTDYVRRFIPEADPERVCAWIDQGAGQPVGRYWVLDPIDGTKGFLRGGQYVVALALIEAEQVQLGVLGCPNLTEGSRQQIGGVGSLVTALRGQGAWAVPLDGMLPKMFSEAQHYNQLRVSTITDPTQIRLLSSFEAAHTNTGAIDRLLAELGIKTEAVRLDSQAKYSLLAGGCGEVMLRLPPDKNPNYKEKIWDQAAGSLIVEEAGGRITDLHGNPLDFSAGRALEHNRGVLATNGPLHERIVELLSKLIT